MSDARLSALVARAFDYRGYVTLRRHDGTELVGFIFDRGDEYVQVLDETATSRTVVPLKELADISFTGEDAAEKSQRIWEKRKGALEPGSTSAWGDWDEEKPALILVALDPELRCVARAMGGPARNGAVRGRLNGGAAVALAVGLGGGARQSVEAEKPPPPGRCENLPALRWKDWASWKARSSAPPASRQPPTKSAPWQVRTDWRWTWRAGPPPALRARPAFPGSRCG
jgi:hypothetical protein